MRELKIIVAAHKAYRMPEDACYLPLQVGSAGKPPIGDWQRDDAGENISAKNANWCGIQGVCPQLRCMRRMGGGRRCKRA